MYQNPLLSLAITFFFSILQPTPSSYNFSPEPQLKPASSPIHSHLDSATPYWPAEEDTTAFLYWTRPSPTRPAPESSVERSRRSALQSKLNSENLRTSAKLSVSCLQFLPTGGTWPPGPRRTPYPIVSSRLIILSLFVIISPRVWSYGAVV
ncbi:hypothetical protein AVEN_73527-1 [Araneus ventricosus]|uniref:BHLH domain-containing protein n=1 Tax=Araneus ventricosus TaxID=182803 RepID=A0A4Y2LYN2_ARAVE|nr:hypothetical protein AVEN_125138-1 [Araneus ventricosus]GBN19891.1 hypothetical protein AVEN_73527-1 [Araneus ventricosus]